jgi:pterin-4a-carbinolamine dehydratase
LFLGYSLNDWNLRVILKNVRSDAAVRRGKVDQSDKKLNSWAIQTNPSELETSLWRKREIDIFDMAIDDFAAELADAAKIKI